MQKRKLRIAALLCAAAIPCILCPPAFAVSPEELQTQVETVGKTAASGSVLIWFLCAIAFLKVSQKIDSILSTLGLNVGHTGDSILAETMIAVRSISGVRSFGGRRSATNRNTSQNTSNVQNSHTGSGGGFLSGGLVGAVSRTVQSSAVKSTVQSANTPGQAPSGIGGAIYSASVQNGGSFANSVIGTIATGSIQTVGTLTGERATEALDSYLGYAAQNSDAAPCSVPAPTFSDVEIGGGRITGTETSDEHPGGIAFGMYNASQYTAPEGNYATVYSADGEAWYKQYARPVVERTPYKAPDGSIDYQENIVQRLPHAPQRKDKL